VKSAKFDWAAGFLPYDPDLIKTPLNSIIGGASLWAMTTPNRTPAEYKAVADFLVFIAGPGNAAQWSQRTGYVPVTHGGYEVLKAGGFYAKNPGADIGIRQLARGTMTDNSRGIRLGRLPEIRTIIEEELESALQGNQTAQQAMDKSVERGNRVLRAFEKSVKT
jgi:sn-glycerol 3-phosphate transport system substrate-binding protein